MRNRIMYWGAICSICFTLVSGCDNGSSPSSEARYEEGETLASTWCVMAQMHLAGLKGTKFDEASIHQIAPATSSDLTLSKSSIDNDSDTPIGIVGFLEKMSNTFYEEVPASLTTNIICKMKSQDGIEHGLGVEISGDEGTCQEINQMALDWAWEQLSSGERTRYEKEGKKLILTDDLMGISGSTWYGTQSKYTMEQNTYTLASSALLVPYEMYPEMPDELRGVHYCKLLAPSQALFWMLYRAFWDDPLGAGPGNDNGAMLVTEMGCEPIAKEAQGSCIFYFEVSGQHFCEEYTGVNWNETSSLERCAGRAEGVFNTGSCASRTDETSQLDGDGEYKGVCMINCGTDEEYRWHVYSEPEGDTPIDQYCQDWFSLM